MIYRVTYAITAEAEIDWDGEPNGDAFDDAVLTADAKGQALVVNFEIFSVVPE